MEEPRRTNLLDDLKPLGYGVVLFDLKEAAEGRMEPALGKGWASANGERSFRISSHKDLDDRIIWICNLGKNAFWKLGAHRIRYLRESGFFRVELGQIMREVGLVSRLVDTAYICEYLSEIASRTIKLSVQHYRIGSVESDSLSLALREALIPEDTAEEEVVAEALARATQDYVVCPTGTEKAGQKRIVLRRPRLSHARDIVDTAIPSGKWEFLSEEDLPVNSERLDWLMQKQRPVLVRVSIKGFLDKTKPHVLPLLQMGDCISTSGRKKERNFMTLHEARYFSRFCKLEIQSVIMAEGWEELKTAKSIPDYGPLSTHSVSLGLMAENHWVSLTNRFKNPVTGFKTMLSARAVWLKATDRFLCFSAALPLASQGFSVSGYGLGGVSVLALPEQFQELEVISGVCGLIYPVGFIYEGKET